MDDISGIVYEDLASITDDEDDEDINTKVRICLFVNVN